MSHIFIPDYISLDKLKDSYRLEGRTIVRSSEIKVPGIFFIHKSEKDILLEKVDPELITKLIRTWEDNWK